MPLYQYKCHWCLKLETAFRKIADRLDVPSCPKCAIPMDLQICAPMLNVDIEPYQSPATGKIIASRAQRREDLKASGCVEWDHGMKEEVQRASAQREAQAERELDATIDSAIAALPARKREALEGEMEAGITAKPYYGTAPGLAPIKRTIS